MLQAHIQAWVWIDEWWGLTLEDIRRIEKETQLLLAEKYGDTVEATPPVEICATHNSSNTASMGVKNKWRMDTLRKDSTTSSGAGEEFFDCHAGKRRRFRNRVW